ncbi:MAG: hypothetical protein PHH85_03530 [Candidatus Methanoperedens sp.]|nr:hypothetical protein [Candidatus Methanoperedens sp.]
MGWVNDVVKRIADHAANTASHGRTNIDGVTERDGAIASHAALAASHGRTSIDGVTERDAAIESHRGSAVHGSAQPPQAHDNTKHNTAYEAAANKGIANGYAGLGADAKVPVTNLPRAYGQAYRTTLYSLAAVNVWYDLPFDGGDNNLTGVSHSTVTNPERMVVSEAGVYLIIYGIVTKWTSGDGDLLSRIVKNGTTEVIGSMAQTVVTGASTDYTDYLTHATIVSLAANDYITVQAGSNFSGNRIGNANIALSPDPTTFITASVNLVRIG